MALSLEVSLDDECDLVELPLEMEVKMWISLKLVVWIIVDNLQKNQWISHHLVIGTIGLNDTACWTLYIWYFKDLIIMLHYITWIDIYFYYNCFVIFWQNNMWLIRIFKNLLSAKININEATKITWNNVFALKSENQLLRFKSIFKFWDQSFQVTYFKTWNFKTWIYFSCALTWAVSIIDHILINDGLH